MGTGCRGARRLVRHAVAVERPSLAHAVRSSGRRGTRRLTWSTPSRPAATHSAHRHPGTARAALGVIHRAGVHQHGAHSARGRRQAHSGRPVDTHARPVPRRVDECRPLGTMRTRMRPPASSAHLAAAMRAAAWQGTSSSHSTGPSRKAGWSAMRPVAGVARPSDRRRRAPKTTVTPSARRASSHRHSHDRSASTAAASSSPVAIRTRRLPRLSARSAGPETNARLSCVIARGRR